MQISSDSKFVIEYGQTPGLGAPWIVRLYRKRFLFRKLISTDWFLDEEQARRFARQLAGQLGSDEALTLIRQRRPGWTLRRPDH